MMVIRSLCNLYLTTIGSVEEVEELKEGKATVKQFAIPLPLSEITGTVTEDVHAFVIPLISF